MSIVETANSVTLILFYSQKVANERKILYDITVNKMKKRKKDQNMTTNSIHETWLTTPIIS